jgi:hypothetical protein
MPHGGGFTAGRIPWLEWGAVERAVSVEGSGSDRPSPIGADEIGSPSLDVEFQVSLSSINDTSIPLRIP